MDSAAVSSLAAAELGVLPRLAEGKLCVLDGAVHRSGKWSRAHSKSYTGGEIPSDLCCCLFRGLVKAGMERQCELLHCFKPCSICAIILAFFPLSPFLPALRLFYGRGEPQHSPSGAREGYGTRLTLAFG